MGAVGRGVALLVLAAAIGIAYVRVQNAQVVRTRTVGQSVVEASPRNNTEAFSFTVRSTHPLTKFEYTELTHTLKAGGRCGADSPVPGPERICTQPFHMHWDSTWTLTVLKGTMGHRVHSTATDHLTSAGQQPVSLPMRVAHTYWAARDPATGAAEDLVVRVRVEAPYTDRYVLNRHKNNAPPQGFVPWERPFEQWAGIHADAERAGVSVSFLQRCVLYEAQGAYPGALPWWLARALTKACAFVGRHAMGFSAAYPEYSTIY